MKSACAGNGWAHHLIKLKRPAESWAVALSVNKVFDFSGYTLREVAMNANDQGFPGPRMRASTMSMSKAEDASVPVEAGKSAVVVSVSGAVQLK